MFKQFVAVLLSLVIPVVGFAASSENGYKVRYDGGWSPMLNLVTE